LITLDADTVFSKDTIKYLVRHFDDPKVGAVAGNAKVGNRLNLLTRWQALEYIVSQNLDRRAFAVLNCITVVPGAVGAWRRDLVLQA
jgi:cellulose synthase/poly-beta-1,6-N-acetylglucosamine synthase-like glycosyltransferase